MIEDAAAELFLEQTYDGTTIEQIAQRAGVSRNTFFNYFGAKSDVLWVDLDAIIDRLAGALAESPREVSVIEAVRSSLVRVTSEHPADRVPWALTQVDLMQTQSELRASAMTRFLRASELLETFIESRESRVPGRVFSYAVLGAAVGAAAGWIGAGISRGPLVEYVEPAIVPVCAGFADSSE
jgi:AcrR family transcriptional regulator